MAEFFVQHRQLWDLVKEIFMKHNVNDEYASRLANMMISANLRGVSSHGVLRVSNYINRIKAGGSKIDTKYEIVKETPSTAIIEGNDGFGAVVLHYAAQLAREKAKKNSIAMVIARNTEHSGALQIWSLLEAQGDMIGIAGTAAQPLMPPAGGKSVLLGNNPFTITVPCGDPDAPICLDMACSIAAGGKIIDLRQKGQQMPLGWALDRDGNPTTDPNHANIFLPIAGHKGYGLSFIVECLSSILSGGAFGEDHGFQYEKLATPNRVHTFLIAIDIAAFRDIVEFKKSADQYIAMVKGSEKLPGVEKIYYPGEIEAETRKNALKNGIKLGHDLLDELTQIAIDAGIPKEKTAFLKSKPVN